MSAQTASVIKATGGAANISAKQIGNLAGAISQYAGIDDEVIQQGANMLLTFKNIQNSAGAGNKIFNQATKTLTDMSVAMGTEPKQAAIQLGKALNDPIKGISALSRVGVTFDAQQQKTIRSLVASGKTMEAQKIILKELNSEFGGSAAAQATAGDKMSVAWGNLKEQIGTALLPVLDKVESFMTTRAIPAVSNFLTQFQNDQGGPGKLRDELTELYNVGKTVFSWMNSNRGVVVALVSAFAAYKTVTLFAGAIRAVNFALAANPIGLVVAALAGLVVGLVYAYKHSQTFRNIVNGAFNAVKKAGETMWHALQAAFKFIASAFLTVVGTILNGAAKAFGWVPGVGPKLKAAAANFNTFRDQVNASLSGIHKDVSVTVHAQLSGAAALNSLLSPKHLARRPPASLPNTGNSLKDLLGPRPRTAVGAALKESNRLAPRLAAVNGKAMTDSFGAARKAAQQEAPKLKSDLAKHSESIAQALGGGISSGEKKWIEPALKKLTDAVSKRFDAAKQKVDDLKSKFASVKDSVAQAFSGDLFSATATFGDLGGRQIMAMPATDNFSNGLLDQSAQLDKLLAAQKKLRRWGVSPKFLSALFASGNSELALGLADGSKASALSDAKTYGSVLSKQQQLGSAVARDQFGQQISVAQRNLDEVRGLRKDVQHLAKQFADELNATAKAARDKRKK